MAEHVGQSRTLSAKLKTLAAIVGPGLIVMIGDNDADAFATYTQAGQNYGTALLWTLLLLVPVLYVNQEMVLRLGAVAGVGQVRGVRPIERAREGAGEAEAELVRGCCPGVRSAITEDGRTPPAAPGLKRKARLEAVADSLDRVEAEGGSRRHRSRGCAS